MRRHLIVVCGDWLSCEEVTEAPLPQLMQSALAEAVDALGGRCVVVCTGGATQTHLMVQHMIGTVEGGVDSCGPGRKVELVLKEKSGASTWGDVWGSALLCKGLAQRQASLVRFERVTIITAAPLAEPTRRVYETILADWPNGGPTVTTRAVPLPADAAASADGEMVTGLTARAEQVVRDDAWLQRHAAALAWHPLMPRPGGGKRRRSDNDSEVASSRASSPETVEVGAP